MIKFIRAIKINSMLREISTRETFISTFYLHSFTSSHTLKILSESLKALENDCKTTRILIEASLGNDEYTPFL